MRSVPEAVRTVDNTGPIDAVKRSVDRVAVTQVRIAAIHVAFVIVVIDLNGVDCGRLTEIDLHPLTVVIVLGKPEGFAAFIGQT